MTLIHDWAVYPSRIADDASALCPEHIGRRAGVVGGMLAEGAVAYAAAYLVTRNPEASAWAGLVPIAVRIGQAFHYRRQ